MAVEQGKRFVTFTSTLGNALHPERLLGIALQVHHVTAPDQLHLSLILPGMDGHEHAAGQAIGCRADKLLCQPAHCFGDVGLPDELLLMQAVGRALIRTEVQAGLALAGLHRHQALKPNLAGLDTHQQPQGIEVLSMKFHGPRL